MKDYIENASNVNRIDLTCPPFVSATHDPSIVGRQIADFYTDLEKHTPKTTTLWGLAAASVGLNRASSIFRSGIGLATALDAGNGIGIENGYHNIRHFIQVLLNSVFLINRNRSLGDSAVTLTQHEAGKVIFAALGHDFYYEPGGNKTLNGEPAPYRLENISFNRAATYLREQCVADNDIKDIQVMISGTDVSPASNAGKFVLATHEFHFSNGPEPVVTEVLTVMKRLLPDRRLTRMAAILGDADILSSAGLTPKFGNLETKKLRAEWGKTTNAVEAAEHNLGFLDRIVGNRFITPEARFFQPNMDYIRDVAETVLSRRAVAPCKAPERRGVPKLIR